MITLDIAHPDVENFITMKQDLSKVTGANVSVRLSDEFMNAVVEDSVKFAEESNYPDPKEALTDIYVQPDYPFIMD